MRLYIKQKVFSWVDRFAVKDEAGQDKYFVEGEFSFGKKLHVYGALGAERAYIEQKLFSFLPRYFVYVQGVQVAEIVKEFTFLVPKYSIEDLGWEIKGDFFAHEYEIIQNNQTIATIHKEWMTWGDCYVVDISNESDEITALSVVIAIDCVMAAQSSSGS